MTVQPIGNSNVALYITSSDLEEHGLSPRNLTLEHAREFAHSAFLEAGISPDGSIEIEAYPEACGVLVFAHIQQPGCLWYTFTEFESLLCAAHAIGAEGPDASLFHWSERYWLSLPPGEEQVGRYLLEFGAEQQAWPYLEGILAEYGASIFPSDALRGLCLRFPD